MKNTHKQEYKKLSLEFPIEEYTHLKMMCARHHVSIKDFVTRAVIRSVEECEDELDLKALEQITEDDRKNAIPWEEAEKQLGWDKL